jgi:hypothetical protein
VTQPEAVCKCGLVRINGSLLSAWLGTGYRDGRWHSMAQCGDRCPTVSTKGVVGWRCALVQDHPGQHHYSGDDGLDPGTCIHTVPMLGTQCVLPVGHEGGHAGPPIRQPRSFAQVGCLALHYDAEGNLAPCPGYPHPEPRAEAPPPLDPQDGDWVLVYAQVEPMGRGRTPRPEEINVRLSSHGEEYHALVARRYLHDITTPPPWWGRCTHLLDTGFESLVRCIEPRGHRGDHRSGQNTWSDLVSYGYVEEA